VFVDIGALVMVPEDHSATAQCCLGGEDAVLAIIVVQRFKTVKSGLEE
jgi:hypothetical protein